MTRPEVSLNRRISISAPDIGAPVGLLSCPKARHAQRPVMPKGLGRAPLRCAVASRCLSRPDRAKRAAPLWDDRRMLEIDNLVKYFGPLRAVDAVSFSVPKGEVLGFLGPNGAGKSTTMKMITGFLAPSSGTASVCGHDIETE